jgi:hypothetical protein
MAPERVADMTIEELKAVIAEVVAQQLNVTAQKGKEIKNVQLLAPENLDMDTRLENHGIYVLFSNRRAQSDYSEVRDKLRAHYNAMVAIQGSPDVSTGVTHEDATQRGKTSLPQRTKAEQRAKNQALIEWLDEWREEGDEEEQRETFEYLKKVLDEDRLSNRPLFPHQ